MAKLFVVFFAIHFNVSGTDSDNSFIFVVAICPLSLCLVIFTKGLLILKIFFKKPTVFSITIYINKCIYIFSQGEIGYLQVYRGLPMAQW